MAKITDFDFTFNILRAKRTNKISHQWDRLRNTSDPFSRLYYVHHGFTEITIDEQTKLLREGHLYLIPSQTRIMFHKPESDFHHLWIHFTTRIDANNCLFDLVKCPFKLPVTNQHGTFENFLSIWPPADFSQLLLSKGLFLILLSSFISHAHNKPEMYRNITAMRRFKPVLTFMKANLDKPITLQELGKISCMHPTYFSNNFKKCFGVSPFKYFCRMRIMQAQVLLIDTDMPIKNISEAVGYDDVCYFSRLFKKLTGISPAAYRRSSKA